jgi:hypothetical protein
MQTFIGINKKMAESGIKSQKSSEYFVIYIGTNLRLGLQGAETLWSLPECKLLRANIGGRPPTDVYYQAALRHLLIYWNTDANDHDSRLQTTRHLS